MATHELKTLAPFYDAVKSGEKTFELRKNYDRQFQKGDLLRLVKTNRFGKPVGGEVIEKQVSYVLSGFDGIESGYVILGLQDVEKKELKADLGIDRTNSGYTIDKPDVKLHLFSGKWFWTFSGSLYSFGGYIPGRDVVKGVTVPIPVRDFEVFLRFVQSKYSSYVQYDGKGGMVVESGYDENRFQTFDSLKLSALFGSFFCQQVKLAVEPEETFQMASTYNLHLIPAEGYQFLSIPK